MDLLDMNRQDASMQNSVERGTLSAIHARIPLISEDIDLREPGRVLLSAGLAPIDNGNYRGLAYRQPAYVPRAPWREPTSREYEIIQTPDETLVSSSSTAFVTLFKLSERSRAIVESTNLWAQTTVEDARALLRQAKFFDAFEPCLEDVLPFCASAESFHVIGLNVGQPGLPTLGIDAGKRLGIHVDDWDMAPRRMDSRNRICINLGKEPRVFMYINRTLNQLGDELREDMNARGTRVGHEFMAANESCPIISVRIDPCEAYIAPTDNVFHDGTSDGKQFPDVTYNVLGYFRHNRA